MIPINNKYKEPDNDWANDVKGNPIHISQAESGAKGYYCMGCTKQMQAVKFKNVNHQSYFRHHIIDIDTSRVECVHASKEYREKLAYFYFMRVKQIKVPAVYKFPPKGEEGNPILLEEATTITAHRVDRELTFYENEEGEIKWGKNPEIEERFLLIRPDAVFFDKNDKPILFLEFVITHKPDIDKLNKLQRIGINTVQIIVPKLPEPELEKSISSASKVKWTYNEIESNTQYIPISTGDTAGIPFIDEEQRKLFTESYKCRTAQIGNLIRSIKRCLASQSYRRAEHLFEQEIQRVERNTTDTRKRHEELRNTIQKRVKAEFREQDELFRRAEEEFGEILAKENARIQREFDGAKEIQETNFRELEERYFAKREEYSNTERELRTEILKTQSNIDSNENVGLQFGSIREATISLQREIDGVERGRETIRTKFDTARREIESRFDGYKRIEQTRHSENYRVTRTRIDSLQSEFERRRKDITKYFEQENSRVERDFKLDGERIGNKTEDFRRRINDFMEGKNPNRDGLPERFKRLFDAKRILYNWKEEYSTYTRYRFAIDCIRKGDYKKWDK